MRAGLSDCDQTAFADKAQASSFCRRRAGDLLAWQEQNGVHTFLVQGEDHAMRPLAAWLADTPV
jgi:hypothetical protein